MDRRIFFLLVKAEQAVAAYFRNQLSAEGLKVKPGQTGVLFLLEKKNPRTMSELSTALEMENSAVTRIVDRLEKNGLVCRQINESDRREIHVVMTDSGFEEISKTRPAVDLMNNILRNEFADEEIDIFKDILVRMNRVFKEAKIQK